jgi:hypothetical protein
MNDHSKFGASEAYQRHDRTQFFSSNSHNFSNCLFGDLRLEQKEFFYAFQTTSSCHHHPSRFAGPRREREEEETALSSSLVPSAMLLQHARLASISINIQKFKPQQPPPQP